MLQFTVIYIATPFLFLSIVGLVNTYRSVIRCKLKKSSQENFSSCLIYSSTQVSKYILYLIHQTCLFFKVQKATKTNGDIDVPRTVGSVGLPVMLPLPSIQ